VKGDDSQASCNLPTDSVSYSLHVMSESKVKSVIGACRSVMNTDASIAQEVADVEDVRTLVPAATGMEGSAVEATSPASGAVTVSSSPTRTALTTFAPWACPLCTMLNNFDDAVCSMCMTPRTVTNGDGRQALSGEGTGWWCSVCTFINPLSATK
jgi:type II secretory pathway component PulK